MNNIKFKMKYKLFLIIYLLAGWTLEHTSLKPFTYPMPETRFFHAGVNVYKFKIKYGNTIR